MTLLRDPIVLALAAVLLFGIVAFVWAVARMIPRTKRPPGVLDDSGLDAPAEAMPDVLATDSFRDPLLVPQDLSRPAAGSQSSGPVVNKDVADRLETMAQRLTEMQTLLSKQSGSGGGPPIGQGFSPETVDKLLKIIGNVVQQVDILQRALNAPNPNVPAEGEARPGSGGRPAEGAVGAAPRSS